MPSVVMFVSANQLRNFPFILYENVTEVVSNGKLSFYYNHLNPFRSCFILNYQNLKLNEQYVMNVCDQSSIMPGCQANIAWQPAQAMPECSEYKYVYRTEWHSVMIQRWTCVSSLITHIDWHSTH